MKQVFLVLFVILIITGCAGREPVMRPVAQTDDKDRTCESLENEAQTLAVNARSKVNANKSKDNSDVGLGVVGAILFWPALLAMDVKNADGREANNLIDRIEHLQQIAIKKDCDTTNWPVVERYE